MSTPTSDPSNVYKFPVVRSEQGGRVMYVASLSHAAADKLFPMDIEVPPCDSEQRAYDESRALEILEYIDENRDGYVLGALTYAMARDGDFKPDVPGSASGVLTLDSTLKLHCVDGQHRRGAICGAVCGGDGLQADSVAVILYVEPNIDMRRQMFADMNSHQKRVNGSLNVFFEGRDPFAIAAKRLIQTQPLLRGRVEVEKPSVSRNARELMTLNAVFRALQRLYTGAGGRVRDPMKYGTADEIYAVGNEFMTLLLSRPEFYDAHAKPKEIGTLRDKTILLSGTTVQMIASAIHALRETQPTVRIDRLTKAFKEIEFKPRAWQKCGFVSAGKSTPNGRLQEVKSASQKLVIELQAALANESASQSA